MGNRGADMSQGYIDENGQYQDPPNFCPACGSQLAPFMGPEDGPAETWEHPEHPSCKWTEYQNLSTRQIAGMRAAATRAKSN